MSFVLEQVAVGAGFQPGRGDIENGEGDIENGPVSKRRLEGEPRNVVADCWRSSAVQSLTRS